MGKRMQTRATSTSTDTIKDYGVNRNGKKKRRPASEGDQGMAGMRMFLERSIDSTISFTLLLATSMEAHYRRQQVPDQSERDSEDSCLFGHAPSGVPDSRAS